MSRLLPFLFLLFLAASSHAQQPNYLFHRLSINEGLAQEYPSYSSQDKNGYIWIAGNNVLQRYDGSRFRSFFCGRNGQLPSGVIASAMMDEKQNKIWLLIEDKFGYFDTEKLRYTAVKIFVPEEYVKTSKKMFRDRQGNIIIIYKYKGIVTYNAKTGEASQKNNPFELPQGWQPHSVCQDDAMNYWISNYEGLVKYNSTQKTIAYRGHNLENDPIIRANEKDREMGIVYFDKRKILWVAAFRPIHSFKSYHTVTGEVKDWKGIMNDAAKAFTDVVGMNELSDGSLWIYGISMLASINYDKCSLHFISQMNSADYSIRYDEIANLSEDREQSIWVCSNKGLYRFNPSAHFFYGIKNRLPKQKAVSNVSVTGFLELADGKLLVSTWGGGVFGYDKEFSPVVSKFAKGSENNEGMTWCMLQRKNGDVWKGLQEGHLVIDEAKGNKSNFSLLEAANGKTIRQIIDDKAGNIWLGTQEGRLIKWDAETKTFSVKQKFQRTILRLFADSKGKIWACTDNDGVYCINAGNGSIVQHYTSTGPANTTLLVNSATDVVEYNDTTIVIAANGFNILNLHSGKFTYWDVGAQIFSMVMDNNRNLWASTNIGIICRQLHNERIHYSFDARDGISNFAFNTGSSILLKNGNIAFGTNHEFFVFNPARALNFSVGHSLVNISGIIVGDTRLPVDSVVSLPELELPPDKNSLIFQFTNNQFQTKQLIYYKLEGKDKDWKQTRYDGEVNLTYLSPGHYTLLATTFNEKLQPTKITAIHFKIATPFYKSWWFYSVLALTVIALFVWYDSLRTKGNQAMQNMRSKIAGQLHEEVNIALNNINILSEMARIKAANEPHKAVEFIEQINSTSNNMIISMDDMLWSIAPQNDSMGKAVERMMEYIDALNNRHAVQIEMLVDEKVYALKPNMQLRHEAFLLFKESIKGLVDSGVVQCKIHLASDKSYLLYAMQFNTGNCDMQQLNGLFHRQDISQRVTNINAILRTEFHKIYSRLELRVPIGK